MSSSIKSSMRAAAGLPVRWLKRQRRQILGIERQVDIPQDVRAAARSGLAVEIGGPTPFFQATGFVPVYPLLGSMKIFNFASETRWESNPQVQVHDKQVPIFTAEAAALPVSDQGAALVLSSHVIEHLANPITGMLEIARILQPNGRLMLIVPHRDGTYDRRRPVTTMNHLEEDFASHTAETDTTHVDEILRLHDLSRDTTTPSKEALESAVRLNALTRFCHHHVFDTPLALLLLDRAGLEPTFLQLIRPYHIVLAAKLKSTGGHALTQSDIATRLKRSPFSSDRSR